MVAAQHQFITGQHLGLMDFCQTTRKLLSGPMKKDGIEGGSSKFFTILESTHEHTPPGILPKGNS